MAINLLPGDLSPRGPVVRISNFIRSLAVISFSILILVALGIGALFVLNTIQIKSVTSQNEELKNSIRSLEKTEQGVVLIKDRLTKAKMVLAQESGKEEVEGLAKLYSSIEGIGEMAEAIVSRNAAEVTFIAPSSLVLSQLMGTIITQDSFKNIELMSFTFNPNAGYVLSFILKTI